MAALLDRLTDDQAMSLVKKIQDPFMSLPRAPKGFIEFLVKIAPWFALLGGILSIIGGPLAVLGSLFSLAMLSPMTSLLLIVAAVVSIVNAVLLLMAFGPLKRREMKGWMYIFWGDMLGIAQTILGVIVGQGSIVSLVFILIGVYLLFEMKPFYTAAGKAE